MDKGNGEDKIDTAIKAAEAPQVIQVDVKISSTGRTVRIIFPPDLSDGEVAEFIGWCGTAMLGSVREVRERKAHGGLVIASRLPSN